MSNVSKAGAEPFSRTNTLYPSDPGQLADLRADARIAAAAVPKQTPAARDTSGPMPTSGKVAMGSWVVTLLTAASSAPGEAVVATLAASLLATGIAFVSIARSQRG